MKKKTITLCSSVSFYEDLIDIENQLKLMGFNTLKPNTVEAMKKSGNYNVQDHKTWLTNPNNYSQKTTFISDHFKKIEKADAILVVNNEKNSLKGYIGGNVLIEMAIAFYLNKPIYILNDIEEKLPIKEEVLGLTPTFIHGDLSKIPLKN